MPLVIQSGGTGSGQTNGLVVNVAASSQLTLSGGISSGYGEGINLTLNNNGSATGTLIISGVSAYQGVTAINGGTLSIAASNNLGSGQVALANNAILQFTGGTAVLTNAVSLGTAAAASTCRERN